ncbi:ankyrin [Aspergillus californicus]
MADSVWEAYKPDLHRLYIREGKKLAEVIEYMASKYSFEATKALYGKYFARWGFQKNQKISLSEGIFIGKRITKRKQMFDKDSEVYVNGNEYTSKIKKAVYGKAYVSTFDSVIVPGAPSPDTLERIVVCTPVSPGMRLSWNTSFPWLRFSKLLKPSDGDGLPSSTSTLAVTSPRDMNLVSYTVNTELLGRLKFVVPWSRLSQPPNINSSSRTATSLRILMPEEFVGQHHALATRFCEGKQSTLDTLSLEMFLLSNKLVFYAPEGKFNDSMEAHHDRLLEMLRTFGWNNATQFRTLLSTTEPTAGAIAENLFASALRQLDLGTIGFALDAGMNPHCPIDTFNYGPLTPLQYLATVRRNHVNFINYFINNWDADDGSESEAKPLGLAKFIDLFVHHGADVDLSYNGISPLQYAVWNYNKNVIERLLSHGAQVTWSCLVAAAGRIPDPKLFSQLLRPDTNVNTGPLDTPSPLMEALRCGNMEIIRLLISRGADVNALHSSTLKWQNRWQRGVTTVLGHAVVRQSLEVVGALLDACPNINPELDVSELDGLPFLSPVLLAVQYCRNDQQILERLLRAGIDLQVPDQCGKQSLIELALQCRNIGACEVLLRYGAMINRPLYTEEQTTSALVCAILCGAIEFANVLIMKGARLNDVYTDSPGTVLGAAIGMGDISLIQSLQAAGAAVVGPRVSQIGNVKTAEYLEESGILGEILKVCGTDILAAALLARNDDLVRKLLSHNLDLNSLTTSTYLDGQLHTPLELAIRAGRPEFVYDMLDLGAKVTDCELAAAVYRQRCEPRDDPELLRRLLIEVRGGAPTALLQLLLTYGVDPTGTPAKVLRNTWMGDGLGLSFEVEPVNSVLELVPQFGNTALLEALFKACPWDSKLVGRALTLAMYFRRYELVEYFLDWPVSVDQEITIRSYSDAKSGSFEIEPVLVNPLQLAAENEQVSLVQNLVSRGNLDVNYLGEGTRRRTALQHAVENGNMDLVNLLISQGADINIGPATNGGVTALQIASIQGFLGIARTLIDMGADINAAPATMNGRTALEGAAEHGRIDMLHMLLDEGASVTGEDGERQYHRAIDFAERNGHFAAAKLLISFEPREE